MLQIVAVFVAGYALYLLWKIGFLLEDVSKAADPIKKAVWGIKHKLDVMEGRMDICSEYDKLETIKCRLDNIDTTLGEISGALNKLVTVVEIGNIDEIYLSTLSIDDEVRSVCEAVRSLEDTVRHLAP